MFETQETGLEYGLKRLREAVQSRAFKLVNAALDVRTVATIAATGMAMQAPELMQNRSDPAAQHRSGKEHTQADLQAMLAKHNMQLGHLGVTQGSETPPRRNRAHAREIG
jgi:hypothetical protein